MLEAISVVAAGANTFDPNDAVNKIKALLLAILILVLIALAIRASWSSGSKGNIGKAVNQSVAGLLPVILLGGLAGAVSLLIWGGDILRAFNLIK